MFLFAESGSYDPYMVKNPSKIFSGNSGPISTKLGLYNWGLQPIIVCSNDDPWLTLAHFTAMSNFVIQAFLYENMKTMDFS